MNARDERQLAEDLARLLDGDVVAADDLGSEDELQEMLVLASSLRQVEPPRPRAEFRSELRDRLLREARESSLRPVAAPAAPETPSWVERVRDGLASAWQSGAVATASIVGAVAILGIGIVAAAEHAQPGELLYGVKQASEQVRLTLVTDEVELGELHLRLAERRLDEVVDGAATASSSNLIDGLSRTDRHTSSGAAILLEIHHEHGETAIARDLRAFSDRQRELLEATLPELPATVVPFAEDSLRLLDRIDAELDGLVLHGCVPCAEFPDGPVGGDTARCCPTEERSTTPDVREPTRDTGTGASEPTTDPDGNGSGLNGPGTSTTSPDTSLTDDVDETVDELTDRLEDTLDETVDDLRDLVDDVNEDLGGLLDD